MSDKSTNRSRGLTNGLAVSDDAPLDYFFRYAGYHFDALADLKDAEERGASFVEREYLAYFAFAWREMARSQVDKYGVIINRNSKGHELLVKLDLLPPKQSSRKQRGSK